MKGNEVKRNPALSHYKLKTSCHSSIFPEIKQKLEALLMAGLLDCMAGNLLGKIAEADSQVELQPFRNEFRKLETTVSALKAVLIDAEQKEESFPELVPLLKLVNDCFNEASDLFDELECEYLKWRVQNRKSDSKKVSCVSSCSSNLIVHASKIAERINKVREILDDIEKTMWEFPLVEEDNEHIKLLKCEMTLRTSISGSQVFSRLLRSKREVIALDTNDPVFGREEAKKSIVDKLLMQGDNKEGFTLFSIHGIDGMGKTTLAKLVYNDEQVFDFFDKRMWVCVSQDFGLRRVKREILNSATGEQVIETLTEFQLQTKLHRNLNGRKFLLVLDDIGTLNPINESSLKEIVKMGADGSRIIVTTRNEPVPVDHNKGTVQPSVHKIEKLDEENSKHLFEYAFDDLAENIREAAEELVPKCNGVPLAIKCIAGLLNSEVSGDAEWVNVKDMVEMWNQREEMNDDSISPALKLSYDLMPSYLKPCFLCFSFLPKDHVFYSHELIQLWMAHGILQSPQGREFELVGEQYFKELQSRGLLEEVEEHALGYWFKIHGLVHDFAVKLAQKEQEAPGSLLHLSFMDSENLNLPPSASSNVRSLSIPVGGNEPQIIGVPVIRCICEFKQLRFLYLCNSSLEEIPTTIDTLKHLKYLDLRGNQRIKRLPESICNLQSLQTLILAFCSELEELPRNIKNMVSLRMLWITTKQIRLGKDGIGNLTSLRFLAIGGCENLTQLFEDINKLHSLQTFMIYDCKSLLSLPEGLKTLTGLSNMAIWGCHQLKFTFSLSSLRLKKLILKGFPAFALLPQWIHDSHPNLEVLEIGEFPKLQKLPIWFSDLWGLRILGISRCPRLPAHIPNEDNFWETLEELRITFCGSLSTKCKDEKNHEELEINEIPNIYVDSRRIMKLEDDDATTEQEHDDEATPKNANGGVEQEGSVKPDEATAQNGHEEREKGDNRIKDSHFGVGGSEGERQDGTMEHEHNDKATTENFSGAGKEGEGAKDIDGEKDKQDETIEHKHNAGEKIDTGISGVGREELVKPDRTVTQTWHGTGVKDKDKIGDEQDETTEQKHNAGATINTINGGVEKEEPVKPEGAGTHTSHGGVKDDGAIRNDREGEKYDGIANDGDKHSTVAEIEGVRNDGLCDDKKQTGEEEKHDGDIKDSHGGGDEAALNDDANADAGGRPIVVTFEGF